MAVNRYATPAKLPNAQPFFELPFNEMAGAISARQQRYDVMQESLAKAQADANKIMGIPGTVQEKKAKEIQSRLSELGKNYVDKDLAGADGSALLGEIRKIAFDPAIPYITESYKNWEKANDLRSQLKLNSKYNEYLAEDPNLPKLGLNEVYNFSPTAYTPEDIGGTYFASVKPDGYEDPVTGEVIEYIDFDTKILPQAQKMAQHYITTPNGAAELVVAKSSWDGSEASISMPGKSIGELSDVELGAEILARGGSEYLYDKQGYQTTAEGKRKGGASTAPKDLSIVSYDATVGYNGVTAAWAASPSANKHILKETNKNMERLVNSEDYKNSITGLDKEGNIIPGSDPRVFSNPKLVNDNFDFVVYEESTGDLSFIMQKKPNSSITPEQEASIQDEYSQKAVNLNINRSLAYMQNKEEAKTAADYDKQLRQNLGIGDYSEEEAIKKNPQIRDLRISSYIDGLEENHDRSSLSWVAIVGGYSLYNPQTKGGTFPTPDEYEKFTEYMYSPDGAEKYYRETLVALGIPKDEAATRAKQVKEEMLVKADEIFYNDLQDVDKNYAKLQKAYADGTRVQQAAGYTYTFGATEDAVRYKKVIGEDIANQVASSALAVFDRQSNQEVTKDAKWGGWLDAEGHFVEGAIDVVGWRPDPDPMGGIAVDFVFRDGSGKKLDEKVYEVRGVNGIEQYLVNNAQYDLLEYKSNFNRLHKGLERDGGWRTEFSMGPKELSINVERAMADDRNGAYKKGWYRFQDENGVWKAAKNEYDLFAEYKKIAYKKGTTQLETSLFESITSQYGHTPNFGDPQPLPEAKIDELSSMDVSGINPLVTPKLTKAMILQESSGDPNIVNKETKAIGLTQVLPSTSRAPGFKGKVDSGFDPYDPTSSVRFSKQYMSELLSKYNNNLRSALMAYNWGYVNVDKWIADGENINDPKAIEALKYYEEVMQKLKP